MELAQLLDNKPTIGKAVRAAFENAEENWGVKVTRFEIQSLRPSEEIVKLTEKLSRTQREATAELEKTRSLQAALNLEAEIETMIHENNSKQTTDFAYANKMLTINGVDQSFLIQMRQIEAFKSLAASEASTVLLPHNLNFVSDAMLRKKQ